MATHTLYYSVASSAVPPELVAGAISRALDAEVTAASLGTGTGKLVLTTAELAARAVAVAQAGRLRPWKGGPHILLFTQQPSLEDCEGAEDAATADADEQLAQVVMDALQVRPMELQALAEVAKATTEAVARVLFEQLQPVGKVRLVQEVPLTWKARTADGPRSSSRVRLESGGFYTVKSWALSRQVSIPQTLTSAVDEAVVRLLQFDHLRFFDTLLPRTAGPEGFSSLERHVGRYLCYSVLAAIERQPTILQKILDKAVCTPKVMNRAILMQSDRIECRVHFFHDASETLIHTHKNRFQSFMLRGTYWHSIYELQPCADGQEYHRFHRRANGNFEAASAIRGRLVKLLAHEHKPTQRPLEIHDTTLHSVHTEGTEPPITLVVRFLGAEGPESVFVSRGPPQPDLIQPNHDLPEQEVAALRSALEAAVRHWRKAIHEDLAMLLDTERCRLKHLLAFGTCDCPMCASVDVDE